MKSIALTLASLIGFAALPALAQDLPEIADTDSNGIWSLTEFETKGGPARPFNPPDYNRAASRAPWSIARLASSSAATSAPPMT